MKKTGKIILIVAIVLLLGLGYYIFASFNGSIIKKIIVTSQTKDYVAENYPDTDYEVSFCVYDFKICNYFCKVQSKSSEDTYFYVWNNKEGMTDDFDLCVNQRQNTLQRLSIEIDDYIENVMAEKFPYRTSLVLADVHSDMVMEDAMLLELDMPFDIKTFPLNVSVTVWVETQNEEPTWEELQERLVELEESLRGEIPTLSKISISIQDRYEELDNGFEPKDPLKTISIYDVPTDIIESDELTSYLETEREKQEEEEEMVDNGEEVKDTEAAEDK